jgi:hypothetical protein
LAQVAADCTVQVGGAVSREVYDSYTAERAALQPLEVVVPHPPPWPPEMMLEMRLGISCKLTACVKSPAQTWKRSTAWGQSMAQRQVGSCSAASLNAAEKAPKYEAAANMEEPE